jgi:hypothetical protein
LARRDNSHPEPRIAAAIARFERRRIVLKCVEVKAGHGVLGSIPQPAARVRLTGSDTDAVRTFVRPVPRWMVQIVVMACRVLPGCAPTKRGDGRERVSATPFGVTLIVNWPPGDPRCTRQMDRGDRHKVVGL